MRAWLGDHHRVPFVDDPAESHAHARIGAQVFEPRAPLGRVDVELPVAQEVVELDRIGRFGARLEVDERVVHEAPVRGRRAHLAAQRAARQHQQRAAAAERRAREHGDERAQHEGRTRSGTTNEHGETSSGTTRGARDRRTRSAHAANGTTRVGAIWHTRSMASPAPDPFPFELRPLSAHCGAEVHGVDLARLDAETTAWIHAQLVENGVLVFPQSGLDDDGHLALARRFGEPSVFPMQRVMGATEPTFQVIRDDAESRPTASDWHTDVTWTAEPPKMAFLRATIVPDRGGDTMWASTAAAFEALSAPMQRWLRTLRVVHDNTTFIAGMRDKLGAEQVKALGLAEKLTEHYPPVEHPLVRTHPETGREVIFFGGDFMRRIVGLGEAESDALLRFLGEHIDDPRFHCRWRWQEGDLAIWDERMTVHRAVGDHYPRVREVRRCVVDGDRPV